MIGMIRAFAVSINVTAALLLSSPLLSSETLALANELGPNIIIHQPPRFASCMLASAPD